MTVSTDMSSDDSWMTSGDPKNTGKKIALEMETIPTKFQIHMKVYTNMISDGLVMRLPIQKLLLINQTNINLVQTAKLYHDNYL